MSFECRLGCGACCIAPSISSPLPKMPNGKPANVRCLHLTEQNLCELFGLDSRPAVCSAFQAEESICGSVNEIAMKNLIWLEANT